MVIPSIIVDEEGLSHGTTRQKARRLSTAQKSGRECWGNVGPPRFVFGHLLRRNQQACKIAATLGGRGGVGKSNGGTSSLSNRGDPIRKSVS